MTDWLGKTIGRVRIEKLLARGGMAEVYLGTHLTLERLVAVKLLQSHIEEDPDLLERFHREAKVVAGLRHSNIVQIFDFDTIDGHPYIVMEYLRGPTLANYLRKLHEKDERIPLPQVARLLNELTAALDYAPGQHVIHRDIKELQAMTASKKTSATGDFRYGLAFRRSGDQYYVFAISPRTKKWFVLKSSPNALTVLKEGTDEDIHNLDNDDTLRMDAQGSEFVFHVNDKLVGEVTDPDYANGEVGLYMESFDSANTHVHFDKLTVRNFEVSILCTVNALTMNVRNGPGKDFSSSKFLKSGDTVEPVERTADSQFKLPGSDQPGWISNISGYLSCMTDVKLLPVTTP